MIWSSKDQILIHIHSQERKDISGILKTIWVKSITINPPEYNNFPNEFSRYDIHNHGFYENFEPFPIKKEKNLTIGDMIRIRDGLQILRNFLQRIYPNYIVVQQICWLHYRCYTQKSIQPFRDFYMKNNLMYLWLIY